MRSNRRYARESVSKKMPSRDTEEKERGGC